MSMGLSILSITLKVLGVIFLFAAALGLLRFKDPLQRMHAATKAGTIGAGLVLAGAVLLIDSTEGQIIGLLAILFLFLTAPVSGHLLGRAAYVSGAELIGIEERDALMGVLARQADSPDPGSIPSYTVIPPLTDVRFAIIAPNEERIARRARDIAIANDVVVEARAIIDTNLVQSSVLADKARESIKARLADAVTTVKPLFVHNTPKLSLFYTEGDAEALIPDGRNAGSLLILPPSGWCLHGTDLHPAESGTPPADVLRLAHFHAGPVLFTGDKTTPATAAQVVVVDDGTNSIVEGLIWTLKARLWNAPQVMIVVRSDVGRTASIKKALAAAGLHTPLEVVEHQRDGVALVPDTLSDCDAVITSSLPPRLYQEHGHSWRRFIAETWTGEVLVIPHRARSSRVQS
ncbi:MULTISPECIES: monovalent cation/H(+) antiporter subunit G [Pseudomonadota]|jgi:monovalent cation/proton antiporter MnhG/PhaG subunit|uniref:monovalent cation/H(+) antiporter subunit G n=1 Tax=Pseudomonadota TaxID=1224 RepID=UPI0008FB1020|nr:MULTISPECIES: monovalent cation/H(+) antiporter subunit G [Pseudomonadota]MBV5648761.1 monovalent cation/H(+) antiporter subunit G [Pseudomonas aeruginosa]MDC3951915.1 monovalent cation/H(+) antiporter subunit G [Pseudomonas aeruginosa]OHW57114.1 hypothetical protein ABI36_0220845 [Pseudomonas aeruginosa]UTM00521.1 monovalent cation/H(+) antiporter subunit G [Alcaligenes sp. NLF5-7]BEG78169.1 hypothetical protein HBIAX_05268 [Achromobacter xylosoxidans]